MLLASIGLRGTCSGAGIRLTAAGYSSAVWGRWGTSTGACTRGCKVPGQELAPGIGGGTTGASTKDRWGTNRSLHQGSVGHQPEPAPGISGAPTRACARDLWGTNTGINPGVTISAVPSELYAQCGLNAGGMTDFVTRGL